MTPSDDSKLRAGTTVCPLCDKQLKGFMGMAQHLESRHNCKSRHEWGLHYPMCVCGLMCRDVDGFALHLAANADINGRLHSHFLLAAFNIKGEKE